MNRLARVLVLALSAASSGCMRGASPSKETETMTDIPSPTPIVCRPQALSNEERSRSQSLRTELAGATQETKELPTGYAFRYRPDATLFQKAAEWITLERRCCPFLTFELGWQQGDDSAPWLAVTGPEGTKEFLAAEMPELPSAK